MKNIFFLIFISVWILSASLLSFEKASAQEGKEVEVTNFSTVQDSLASAIKKTGKKALADTALKGMKRINWDSIQRMHSPKRAALYSAVLPGLGQIYNKQYIKAPIMMGGIGTAAGIFIFNFNHYIKFRDAYRLRLQGKMTGDPKIDIYPDPQNLKDIRDGYRSYVDYSVLGFAAVYVFNILDAVVFAHLFDFDINEPLGKINIGPVLHEKDSYLGFGITYNF